MTARLFRYGVLLVLGAYFVVPLLAMLDFSTKGKGGSRGTGNRGGW